MSADSKEFEERYHKEMSRFKLPEGLCEHFTVCRCFKEGENCWTVLAEDKLLGQRVVIKWGRELVGKTLEQEYEILTRLNKESFEGIPRPYRLVKQDGDTYFLREYIEGKSLYEMIEKESPIPEKKVREIGRELCRIVNQFHNLVPPLVHKDIKAENIIIREDGTIVLVDFGSARFYREEGAGDTMLIGSKATAAPEQYGFQQTDPRTDVYAIGKTLAYMAAGTYDSKNLKKASISTRLLRSIKKASAFDPQERYESAAELGKALKRRKLPGNFRAAAGGFFAAAVLFAGIWLLFIGKDYISHREVTPVMTPAPSKDENMTLSKNGNPEPSEDENMALSKNGDPELSEDENITSSKNGDTEPSEDENMISSKDGNTESSKNEDTEPSKNGNMERSKNDDTELSKEGATALSKNEDMKASNMVSSRNEAVSPQKNEPTDTEKDEAGGIVFHEKLIEQAVRQELGIGEDVPITEDMLQEVYTLRILGNDILPEDDHSLELTDNIGWSYGVFHDTEQGEIHDLSDLALMKKLALLVIACEKVEDISSLSGLPIQTLVLSNNQITDFSALKTLPVLTELAIAENPATDLSCLSECKLLDTLEISNMRLTDLNFLKELDIKEFSMNQTEIEAGITPLENLKSLEILYMDNVDQESMKIIRCLENLKCFSCYGAFLEPDLTGFAGMQNLWFIVIGNGLTSLEGIEDIPHLQGLVIHDTNVHDLSPVVKAPELNGLNIMGTKIYDYTVLAKCRNLRTVNCDKLQEKMILSVIPSPDFEMIVE